MTRKNTIIIAVFVNAVLLVMLFMTAVKHEEAPITFAANNDSFKEEVSPPPTPLPAETPQISLPVEVAAKELAEPSIEPVIHRLPEPVDPVVPSSVVKEVVVKKGDTLEKIAKANKVSLEELIHLNKLSNSFLRIGQVLKLPDNLKEVTPIANNGGKYYIVKAGDNPWTIAMKHHIHVEELMQLNHMDKEKAKKLKPGDKLRVR